MCLEFKEEDQARNINFRVISIRLVFKVIWGMRLCGMWLPKAFSLGHQSLLADLGHHLTSLSPLQPCALHSSSRSPSPFLCTLRVPTASLLHLSLTAPYSSKTRVSVLFLCSFFLEEWIFLFSLLQQHSNYMYWNPGANYFNHIIIPVSLVNILKYFTQCVFSLAIPSSISAWGSSLFKASSLRLSTSGKK